MQLVTLIGSIFIIASVVLGIQTLARYISGHSLEGFTTIILLLLLVGGSLMISLGIIGLYIAKIYDEVKNRPRFIISESTEKDQ
jgi:dolichol-phosphate mannosyltransferase